MKAARVEPAPAVIGEARERGDAALVERSPDQAPAVVGVLRTRRPSALRLRAASARGRG
jgi:hypothetical protein